LLNGVALGQIRAPGYRAFFSEAGIWIMLGIAGQAALSLTSAGWRLPPTGPRAAIVADLRDAPEPVISEDMVLTWRAGKRLFYQPFEMTQLAWQKDWDETPLLALVPQGAVGRVILTSPLDTPSRTTGERFTPAMLEALRAGYTLLGKNEKLYLYGPKHEQTRPQAGKRPVRYP
jgi:hypothetical protein